MAGLLETDLRLTRLFRLALTGTQVSIYMGLVKFHGGQLSVQWL